jgi:protein translocase SecG subunit
MSMTPVMITLQIAVGILLILLCVLVSPKGNADLGASTEVFGNAKQSELFLNKIIQLLAGLFFVLSFVSGHFLK